MCAYSVSVKGKKNKSIKACLYDAKSEKALKALVLVYHLARILIL